MRRGAFLVGGSLAASGGTSMLVLSSTAATTLLAGCSGTSSGSSVFPNTASGSDIPFAYANGSGTIRARGSNGFIGSLSDGTTFSGTLSGTTMTVTYTSGTTAETMVATQNADGSATYHDSQRLLAFTADQVTTESAVLHAQVQTNLKSTSRSAENTLTDMVCQQMGNCTAAYFASVFGVAGLALLALGLGPAGIVVGGIAVGIDVGAMIMGK